ncbi:MAG: hypothetical protein HOP16_11740 [Acidobacteria bacterium]|nr:hypothetical protein [Acidobacteriota bacterium]
MTNLAAVIPDVDADVRWHDWQARGAASDVKSAARMRNLVLVIFAALIAMFVVQLN